MFSQVCVCSTLEGGTLSQVCGWGVPHPRSEWRGTLSQVWGVSHPRSGGTLSQVWGVPRVPPQSCLDCGGAQSTPGQVWMVGGTQGTPWPGLDGGGYPGYPPTTRTAWGTPQPHPLDRAAEQALAMRRAVCLLRSRRRTFLFIKVYSKCLRSQIIMQNYIFLIVHNMYVNSFDIDSNCFLEGHSKCDFVLYLAHCSGLVIMIFLQRGLLMFLRVRGNRVRVMSIRLRQNFADVATFGHAKKGVSGIKYFCWIQSICLPRRQFIEKASNDSFIMLSRQANIFLVN